MRTALYLVRATLIIILTTCCFSSVFRLTNDNLMKPTDKVVTKGAKRLTTVSLEQKRYLSSVIQLKAEKYGVSTTIMHAVVNCESGYQQFAVGDDGTSFGLVQIHQPAHPQITKEQAFDVNFSLDFLASNLSKGKGNLWSCYKKIYGV